MSRPARAMSARARTIAVPRLLAVALTATAVVTLAGCSTNHQGGFARDVVVQFDLPAGVFTPPAASVAAIEKNCPNGPQVTMEPVPPANALPSVRLNGIRFNVAGADDAVIANLQACLQRQPGVKSANLEDEDS